MSWRDVPARSASDMRPLMQPALTEAPLSLTRQVLNAQGAPEDTPDPRPNNPSRARK
ncbi:hypothetical protein GCM10009564_48160 [Streptomyces thermogriseus]|uniref:Uncharacterized protein n=1 Tax=Streptomyces thermogriseus TaxID=75292 RepID=A0ABP4DN92_9ACTN